MVTYYVKLKYELAIGATSVLTWRSVSFPPERTTT